MQINPIFPVNPAPLTKRQYFYDRNGERSSGYKIAKNDDVVIIAREESLNTDLAHGFSFKKADKTFEQDCLTGKDLPIICDKCLLANVKESKCREYKIDKKKFHQLQDNEYCPKFEKIA